MAYIEEGVRDAPRHMVRSVSGMSVLSGEMGYLYKPERVQPDLDGARRISGDGFDATRLPLVVDFEFGGETIVSSTCTFLRRAAATALWAVQLPLDASLEKRVRQATTILADLATASGPTIALGFNSLYFEEPMEMFTGGGFVKRQRLFIMTTPVTVIWPLLPGTGDLHRR